MSANDQTNVKIRELTLLQIFDEVKDNRWCRFAEFLDDKQIKERGGVVIECNSRRIYAHRLILEANSSPYFVNALNTVTEDNELSQLKYEDKEDATIEHILDFMYVKKVEKIDSEDEFKNVLLAAHLLEIDGLFHYCAEALLASVSTEMNFEFMEKRKLFRGRNQRLTLMVLNFWIVNAKEFICGKELLFLSAGQVKGLLTILEGYLLCVDRLLGLLRWLRHDPEQRTKYSGTLLACVDTKLARAQWVVSLLKCKEQMLLNNKAVVVKDTCSVVLRGDDYIVVQNPCIEVDEFLMTNRLFFFGPCLPGKVYSKDQNSKKVSVTESPLCLQQLNLLTMEWDLSEKLNFACYGDAVCQHGQFLYMVGGSNFAVYDIEKKEFELIDCSKFKDRHCAAMCVFKENMYIVGGYVSDHQTTTVFFAKLGTTEWQDASPLKCSVSDAILLTSTNYIYVIVYDSYTCKISIQFNTSPDKAHPWEIFFVDSNQRLWHTNFFIQNNTLQALFIEHNDTVLLTYDHSRKKMDHRYYHGHPRGLTQVMRVCPCLFDHQLQVYLSTRNDSFRIPNYLWNSISGKWRKLPARKGTCDMPYSVFSLVYTE